jgi:hypothetical protein
MALAALTEGESKQAFLHHVSGAAITSQGIIGVTSSTAKINCRARLGIKTIPTTEQPAEKSDVAVNVDRFIGFYARGR